MSNTEAILIIMCFVLFFVWGSIRGSRDPLIEELNFILGSIDRKLSKLVYVPPREPSPLELKREEMKERYGYGLDVRCPITYHKPTGED